jgi:hypothetical protein
MEEHAAGIMEEHASSLVRLDARGVSAPPMKGDCVVAEDGYLGDVDATVVDESGAFAYVVVRVGPV